MMTVKRVFTTQTSSSMTPKRSTPTFGGGADGGSWVSGGRTGGRFHSNGKGAGSGDNGTGGAIGGDGNVPRWYMVAACVPRSTRELCSEPRKDAPCWHRCTRGWCSLDIVSAHSNPARGEGARAQRLLDMAGRLSTPTDFETELQRIPSVKCALVTDLQGVVLLRAGSSTDEAALQQMAATFALTTDQANKLRLGKTKHFTLCYGALAEGERSCTHTHCLALDAPRLLCPETMTVVHVACSPLVLTLICDRRVLVIAHP